MRIKCRPEDPSRAVPMSKHRAAAADAVLGKASGSSPTQTAMTVAVFMGGGAWDWGLGSWVLGLGAWGSDLKSIAADEYPPNTQHQNGPSTTRKSTCFSSISRPWASRRRRRAQQAPPAAAGSDSRPARPAVRRPLASQPPAGVVEPAGPTANCIWAVSRS